MRDWDVTSDEIDRWAAHQGDAHLRLPELIRRLLFATAKDPRISTRSGKGVFLRDWDLLLEAGDDGPYWSRGVSGWELTTEEGSSKVIKDLAKRKQELGSNGPSIAFVGISGRRVQRKQDVFLASASHPPFTTVRVLDADDLAAWMSMAPAVALWFRNLLGVPGFEDIRPIEEALERWSRASEPPLPERLLLAGGERQDAAARVRAWAEDTESKRLAIVADDPHEAAMFAAAALKLDPVQRERSLSRAAVVTTVSGLEAVQRSGLAKRMLLILDGTFPREAIGRDTNVVEAIARTESRELNWMELPPIPWGEMASVLKSVGFPPDRAEKLAHEARGRVGALRGLLYGADIPRWARDPKDLDALTTLLLVGAFQQRNPADMEFVARVLGRDPSEMTSLCERLVGAEGAPVVVDASRRGHVWGFGEPADAWRVLVRKLAGSVVDRFGRGAVDLLTWGEETQVRDLLMAAHRPESEALVQGACESLARLAQSREELPIHLAHVKDLPSSVVRYVLHDAPRARWAALSSYLQTLAEASPREFLRALDQSLAKGEDGPAGLFRHELSGFRHPHVGLLWALEALAWEDGTLRDIVAILARLADADTEGDRPGKVINRPLNTLGGLLDPVVPHTNATDGEICRAIESLREWPKVAHAFARGALASGGPRMLSGPHTPRFLKTRIPTPNEIWQERESGQFERLRAATELGIAVAGSNALSWAELLSSASYPDHLLEHLSQANSVDDSEQHLWGALRSQLHFCATVREQNHRETERIDEKARGLLAELYERFTPSEPIRRFEWLFRGGVELPFFSASDWKVETAEILRQQIQALESIYAELGIEGVVRLIEHLGQRLLSAEAFVTSSFRDELEAVARERSGPSILVDIYGESIARRVDERGLPWVADQVSKLALELRTSQVQAILRRLPMSDEVLDIVDRLDPKLWNEYWRAVRFLNPSSTLKDYARPLRAMLGAGNFRAVFEYVLHNADKIDSSLAYEVLQSAATDDALWSEVESLSTLTYWLARALDRIRASGSVPPEALARLALRYATRLEGDLGAPGNGPGLPWLTPLLEKEPSVFARWAAQATGEASPPTEDGLSLGREAATRVLFDWSGVPGESASPPERDSILVEWSRAVLAATTREHHDRVSFFLAKVLARATGSDGIWPALAVRQLLDDSNVGALLFDELRVAKLNARGTTARALGEGGRQELVLAARYRHDADRLRLESPRSARLLDDIARSYEGDAAYHDGVATADSRHEGFERAGISGLDALVAMKLAANGIDDTVDRTEWLAEQLQVDRAEVAVSLKILNERRFFRGDGKNKLNPLRLRHYLLQDPPPFPLGATQLQEGVGLPTAHSGPPLARELSDGGEPFIMPLADSGERRGRVVQPIHPHAPLAAKSDPKLYALLSLLDALRVGASAFGTARDTELARKKLLELL